MSFGTSLNNLSLTVASGTMSSAIGASINKLQSLLANGGRDTNCKFYYNGIGGGSLLKVVAKSVVGGAVSELKDMGDNAFKSLFDKKDRYDGLEGYAWIKSELELQREEERLYGKIKVSDSEKVIYALDDWGCIAYEALMLAVDLEKPVHTVQRFPRYRMETIDAEKGIYKELDPTCETNIVDSKTLVWYDTTAVVNTDSNKNVIITRVQGRDYSRKELVSNGDFAFSVSGQITCGKPDLYPVQEVEKFKTVMQYKGIVRVNNIVLNTLGITNIIITDWKLSSREGYKGVVGYSFSAIGLQPETEKTITEDTVTIIPYRVLEEEDSNDSEWLQMLKNQLEGLKAAAVDLESQMSATASGMIMNGLDDVL